MKASENRMRLKVLACETLFREIYRAAAHSPHICDIKFLPRTFHDDLDAMKTVLQEEINRTGSAPKEERQLPGMRCPVCLDQPYDAIVLSMGLCGHTTSGLQPRNQPLVIPRVHDCAGLLLGSNSVYLQEEQRTVFYHQGAVERLGAARVDAVPRRFGLGRSLEEYVEQYGEDNGRYIYQMEHHVADYNDRALFIYHEDMPAVARQCRQEVQKHIGRYEWNLVDAPVQMRLFHNLLTGRWDQPHIMIFEPGSPVATKVTDDGMIHRRHCHSTQSR